MDRLPGREPAPPADVRLQKFQPAFALADWKCGKYCDAIPGIVVTKTLSYQTPEMLTWLG